jgi:hypothetical protein
MADTIDQLHGMELPEDSWWACYHPERPHEPFVTYYDEACYKCLIALHTAASIGLTPYIRHHERTAGVASKTVTAQAWLAENGLDEIYRKMNARPHINS